MTSYLYVCSIGPIQDFIAASRRTRDLWYGSFILSELSKAVAKAIAEAGGDLIFPALKQGDHNLLPGTDLNTFNVANIILAEIPGDKKIEEITSAANIALGNRWNDISDDVFTRAKEIINAEIWDMQIHDVIEFYAAWAPLVTNCYSQSRNRVMRLLAGRKSTRDFIQTQAHSWRVEKSSLDGARENVLLDDKKITKTLALRMRLNKGEKLCAPGLIKRIGGEKIAFPSVVRVALDPWIRGVIKSGTDNSKLLSDIGVLCKGENSYASGSGNRLYKNFPYDGQILFPSRLMGFKTKINDASEADPDDKRLSDELIRLKRIEELTHKLKINIQKMGMADPDPYYAILIADGDRIGKAISYINSADNHRNFSRKLSEFAYKAREIIESEEHGNHGSLVYSGGDDVLAFLPVDTCLKAARELHDTFGELLQEYKDENGISPTLSVGIAIGHVRDPLEDILLYARAAEHHAKGTERDGLALHLHVRSGGDPIKLRECWKKKGDHERWGLDERMEKWTNMYLDDTFPDKAAYDLRQLALEYQGWDTIPETDLEKDVRRLLARKRAKKGNSEIFNDDISNLVKGITNPDILYHRAKELVFARRIAVNKGQGFQNQKEKREEVKSL